MKIIEVAAGIIYDSSGRILIARRKPEKSIGGKWEFPGGKIEAGETPEVCLKRELVEELGINVNTITPFMVTKHNYGDFQILLIVFECMIVSNDIISMNDHDRITWVTKNELKLFDFAPADIPIVEAIF